MMANITEHLDQWVTISIWNYCLLLRGHLFSALIIPPASMLALSDGLTLTVLTIFRESCFHQPVCKDCQMASLLLCSPSSGEAASTSQYASTAWWPHSYCAPHLQGKLLPPASMQVLRDGLTLIVLPIFRGSCFHVPSPNQNLPLSAVFCTCISVSQSACPLW